ncbi:MAG TPA: S8 family serine peptidase [Thermoanaerobaculia bacterium]
MDLAPLFFALFLLAACRPLAPPEPATVRALVDFEEQVDLQRLELRGGRRERGDQVIAALAGLARRSQERLRPLLEDARLVRSWQGFTVVNRLLVEATPAGIEALKARPEVAEVVLEMELAEPALMARPPEGERRSWAVDAVGAPAAWAQGLDGTGVVVGIIDSGASATHEQLAAGFAGRWLDPDGGSAGPRDTRFGHGTGVLSVAVGRNVSGVTLGIAPGAAWIACAALPRGRYNNVLATQCADWMLNAGRPDVLVAAWVLPRTGCDRSLQRIVDAWRAAGILPLFPAGNYGPGERTDRSPANYDTSLSVGGTAYEKTSRGPSACGGGAFPRLTAPAERLIAAFPLGRNTYLTAEGTSFAAGIAAGAAAILVQSRPDALVPELERALGSGQLDIPAALERLK